MAQIIPAKVPAHVWIQAHTLAIIVNVSFVSLYYDLSHRVKHAPQRAQWSFAYGSASASASMAWM